jgi:hypothetical protein
VREKIIGENTLRDIAMLEQALAAAKGVVRVGLTDGAGSGFMIAPDLLMTNHHVIGSQALAERAEFTFNYHRITRALRIATGTTLTIATTTWVFGWCVRPPSAEILITDGRVCSQDLKRA